MHVCPAHYVQTGLPKSPWEEVKGVVPTQAQNGRHESLTFLSASVLCLNGSTARTLCQPTQERGCGAVETRKLQVGSVELMSR